MPNPSSEFDDTRSVSSAKSSVFIISTQNGYAEREEKKCKLTLHQIIILVRGVMPPAECSAPVLVDWLEFIVNVDVMSYPPDHRDLARFRILVSGRLDELVDRGVNVRELRQSLFPVDISQRD